MSAIAIPRLSAPPDRYRDSPLDVHSFGATDLGKVRKENQDSYILLEASSQVMRGEKGLLAVVAWYRPLRAAQKGGRQKNGQSRE